MATTQTAPRGRLTLSLWSLMWLTWLGFVAQQAADVERFSGTWLLSGLRSAPLLFFLWAAFTDSMRLFIWFELVLLFYFISAVEAAFACWAPRERAPARVRAAVCCVGEIGRVLGDRVGQSKVAGGRSSTRGKSPAV